ncbi:MAG TPA: FliH/SctL family protein [Candidatus Baltobacteraceae bacterium]|nr:FliH/SctL family protein [Candidatus Baltobacteraceae bacterium]
MRNDFQPLTALVRPVNLQTQAEPAQTVAVPCACAEAEEAALRSVRLFCAAVAEGVEAAIGELLNDIAADVLARELQLAPADITQVVERALSRYFSDDPLHVLVHPDDACELHCGFPVVKDPCLRAGDARLVLRCGTVDASLGVRLAALLQKFQA